MMQGRRLTSRLLGVTLPLMEGGKLGAARRAMMSTPTREKVTPPVADARRRDHGELPNKAMLAGLPHKRLVEELAPLSTEQLAMVKALRTLTGAPLNDIKKAVVGANGDLEVAKAMLQKLSKNYAEKKKARVVNSGVIAVRFSAEGVLPHHLPPELLERRRNLRLPVMGDAANAETMTRPVERGEPGEVRSNVLPPKLAISVVEVNCETDFVARNEQFQHHAAVIAETQLLLKDESERAKNEEIEKEEIGELIAKFGENIKVARKKMMVAKGPFGYYLHNKLGKDCATSLAIVTLHHGGRGIADDRVIATQLAYQVMATKPRWLYKEDVPLEVLAEEEKRILAQQGAPALSASGEGGKSVDPVKAARAQTFMLQNKLKGWMQQHVLMEQRFVIGEFEGDMVKDVLKDLKVDDWLVWTVGEVHMPPVNVGGAWGAQESLDRLDGKASNVSEEVRGHVPLAEEAKIASQKKK